MAVESYRTRTALAHEVLDDSNILTVEVAGTSFRFLNPDGSPASDFIDTKGDPGAPGADGTNSGITTTAETAGGTIPLAAAVGKRSDGKVYVLDYTTPAYKYGLLGLATNVAALDDPVTVQTEGEITDNSWSFVPYLPVFAGVNGTVSQLSALTMQANRYLHQIGYAIATDTIVIQPNEPERWL